MKRGVGTIVDCSSAGSVAVLTLSVRGDVFELFGERGLTLRALTEIFNPEGKPPISLVGKRVRYQRDGSMLTWLGAVR